MRIRKMISLFFVSLWMVVIFCFSAQPAIQSEANSDAFMGKVIDIAAKISGKEISANRKKEIIRDTRFYVRKLAHFTLYFVLNCFLYFSFKAFGIKRPLLWSLTFCFLFAITDEIHQLFVSKRTGRFFDVVVDTWGAFFNGLIILCINKIIERKKKSKMAKIGV